MVKEKEIHPVLTAAKLNIYFYLTKDSDGSQALFDDEDGEPVFNNITLQSIMEKIDLALNSVNKVLQKENKQDLYLCNCIGEHDEHLCKGK